jgi:TfoX/Sxy family transcriptional regulator of competence genes
MAWRKSPAELIATFEAVLPDDPRVEPRQMFGYPCAFTGGNMFMGLHQENMVLRLSDEDRERYLEKPGAAIFQPMPGRTMREYVVVVPALAKDRAALKKWVGRALSYAASLPVKAKKKPAAKPSRVQTKK